MNLLKLRFLEQLLRKNRYPEGNHKLLMGINIPLFSTFSTQIANKKQNFQLRSLSCMD